MLTPIIIPLGTVQVPLQNQEQNPDYNRYQVHTQYQVPDMQQLPLSDRSTRAKSHPSWCSSSWTAKPASGERRDETTANGTADTYDGTTEPCYGTTSEFISMTIGEKRLCYDDSNEYSFSLFNLLVTSSWMHLVVN